MINDKRLFELMIKYHPTFVGWLLKEKKVEKTDDKFIVCKNKQCEPAPELMKEYNGKIISTNEYGVKRIQEDSNNPNFTRIYPYDGKTKDIVDRGFDLFDLHCSYVDVYCLTSQFENIFINCYDLIEGFWRPKDSHRMGGEFVEYYIKWLEHKFKYYEENEYHRYVFHPSGYVGYDGNPWNVPKVIENIKKYGIFADICIYRDIEWTFDMVEKYKDTIVWKYLIEDSNLVWEMDMLNKYDEYITYCEDDEKRYFDDYYKSYYEKKREFIEDYSKFGLLNNEYLENHKERLNWGTVFKECKFDWNAEEMTHFCEYVLSLAKPYGDKYINTVKYDLTKIIDNPYFHWTSDNLYAWLAVSKRNWSVLVHNFNPHMYSLFWSIPDIKEKARPFVGDIKNFWEIVGNENDFPYDELTPEFTIENIKKNFDKWSVPLRNVMYAMKSHSDLNDHYYVVVTQWDVYIHRLNIPLTYELAKYLLGLNIKKGGTFEEIGNGYDKDYRFPIVNGLVAFSYHHISSIQDKTKCLEDDEITDVLLNPDNWVCVDLVKMVMDLFFKDYSIEKYLDIVNSMKNWDEITHNFADEEIERYWKRIFG